MNRAAEPRTVQATVSTGSGERWRASLLARLPFGPGDATAGSETELLAAVVGDRGDVDLPRMIENSACYRNLKRRADAGDTPRRRVRGLDRFLSDNPSRVWEHSWVRFPSDRLHDGAQQLLADDLRADKSSPEAGRRSDASRFLVERDDGPPSIRVPISYLLRLALADALARGSAPPSVLRTGRSCLDCFLNDNVSPETLSLHLVRDGEPGGVGAAIAHETSRRFLLTQLLVHYANEQFHLRRTGQRATVYFAPHPPVRLRQLSDCVSDSFYRELFTSPCLSGWDRGESKQDYMRLCHQVLGRSQLHAVAKLWDAGLVASNLVVLPSVSNISLANNGTHVSLGSRRLGELLADSSSAFGPSEEKRTGDLVVKVFEHFLPLFVGTYSAAPYRFDFSEFHAENVLAFLPHQLDYSQLRMVWREWRLKAGIRVLGQPISPSGYPQVDRWLSRLFLLRGDVVDDVRLIDYLVAPLSTDESPALDGRFDNAERLKRDLADQGVFDSRMSFYAPFRQRLFGSMGFAGFEGRFYSLSASLASDLGHAVNLQRLVTALAYQLVASGQVGHPDIPDDPSTESERRQMFFATAIGIPHVYVRASTPNAFLERILRRTTSTRPSRRHAGYLKVEMNDYRQAALATIREEAAGLVDALDLRETIEDLDERLRDPSATVAGKVKRRVLERLNVRDALAVPAADFNREAERWYREDLRVAQTREALEQCADDWEKSPEDLARLGRDLGLLGLGLRGPAKFLRSIRSSFLADRLPVEDTRLAILLMLLDVARREQRYRESERPVELRIVGPSESDVMEGATDRIHDITLRPELRGAARHDDGLASVR